MHPVYYIVNWPWHEHADSAKAAKAKKHKKSWWVKAKVDFVGDDWLAMMRQRHAADALAAWEIMRGLAQQSPFRGLILSDGHVPRAHNIASIADKTRVRPLILRRGLDILCLQLGWVATAEASKSWEELSIALWGKAFPSKADFISDPVKLPPICQTNVRNPSDKTDPKMRPTIQYNTEAERERSASDRTVGQGDAPATPPAASASSDPSLSLPPSGSGTATTPDVQTYKAITLTPLAEFIRKTLHWGATRLDHCQAAADRLTEAFPNLNGLLQQGIAAVNAAHLDAKKIDLKPWDLYAAFRPWLIEHQRAARAASAERKIAEDTPDTRTPEQRAADIAAYEKMRRKLCRAKKEPK